MEKIALKRYEVNDIVGALNSLEGRPDVIKDKDGKVHGIVTQPYDFQPETRLALARTYRKLKEELSCYEVVQRQIQSERVPEGEEDTRSLRFREFLAEGVEVDVEKVSISDIKVDTNKLAPQLIATLLPMLK